MNANIFSVIKTSLKKYLTSRVEEELLNLTFDGARCVSGIQEVKSLKVDWLVREEQASNRERQRLMLNFLA